MTDVPVAAGRSHLAGLGIGAGAAIVGLLPWLVTGGTLPAQNLWASVTMPDEMPFALLPVSQYYAIGLLSLFVIGGVGAGLVARVLVRRGIRASSVAIGVVLVHVVAIVQSYLVVGIGLDLGRADSQAALYFAGMLGGAIAATALAQLGFWLTSHLAVAPAALGIALAAVPCAAWIRLGVDELTSPFGAPPVVAGILDWVPAVIVGVALAWCGVQPVGRLAVWAIALLALWVLPALFLSIQFALGMRVLQGDLGEMADAAARLFPVVLGEAWLHVLVAAGIGLIGTLVVERWRGRGVTAHE